MIPDIRSSSDFSERTLRSSPPTPGSPLPGLSRRSVLARAGVLLGTALIPGGLSQGAEGSGSEPFRFCLNTATIRGQKLGIAKEIEVAAKAGFQGIEPWISSIQEYQQAGGSLKELKQRLLDSGLSLESAIGFPEWVVDDDSKRARGLDQARREMDLIAQLGGKRLAAPPAGATNGPKLDLLKAAERYRALLEAGDQIGVVPQLEVWGFSKNLTRLSECASVAIETGHPKACVLADMFHLYKGGSDYQGLKLLSKDAVQVFHLNDYPAQPPRDQINDGFRVFPGEGTAPLVDVLRLLKAHGGQTVLSLEVFNKKYWAQDALEALRTGLERMKTVAAQALS